MKFLMTALLFIESIGMASQNPAGEVGGQLRTPDGRPAVEVRVAVAAIDSTDKEGQLAAIGRTDESGKFHLTSIPPGRYRLIAGSIESPTYYPGTTELSAATVVNVVDGKMIGDLNFEVVNPLNRMSLSATASVGTAGIRPWLGPQIKVRVRTDDGSPLESFGSFPISTPGRLGSGSGESFEIPLPGTEDYITIPVFRDRLAADYYIRSMTYGSIDLFESPLTITSGKLDEIVLTLSKGNHISGSVRNEDGSIPNMSVYLLPRDAIVERPDLRRISNFHADGRFEMFGVAPGDYFLSSANDMDSQRESVLIHVTGNMENLRLVFGKNRGLRLEP